MNLVDSVIDQNAALLKQTQLLEEKAGHPAVHKFGGSSLRCARAIKQVANIIEQNCYPNDFIILSAMGNTTDLLFDLVSTCQGRQQSAEFKPDCSAVRDYQQGIISDLLAPGDAQALINELQNDIQRIEFLLSRAICGQPFNPADVIGYGELWSTRVVCAVLQERSINCQRVDSRDFIYVVDENSTPERQSKANALIDWQKSQTLFGRCQSDFTNSLAVISGYLASNNQGETVLLGRNGSDFSATIVAKLAVAKMVYLWTDVNGVFSADPNQFSQTKVIPLLGLNEATALANLGTPVFHEKTLKPLQDANIPIRIRNSQAGVQDNSGTLILTQPVKWQGAKTITLKESVCLFSIKWANSAQHELLNEALASIINQQQISTHCWLSDNQTLNFCVPERSQTAVAKILTQQQTGESCQFSVNKDLSIISLVGYELLQHGEHLSAYFSLIEQSQKGVLMYHYDTNGAISAVVNDKHPVQLVSSIHQAIFVNTAGDRSALSAKKTLSLVLVGCGNIGRKLVDILSNQLDNINRRAKNQLKVVGISNSKRYIFDADGVNLETAEQALLGSTLKSVDIEQDLQSIGDSQIVIVDVTASSVVTEQYSSHLDKGRHIVSANKLGLTLPTGQYDKLRHLAATNHCQWLSNVTCGAGLPIQQSIEDLCIAGDQIKSIDGIFSGSLSWILSQYDTTTAFSEVVDEAKAIGFTEPDPRDDLSGKDVQRKLLIIARTMGLSLDLEQIQLSPLIPAEFLSLPADEFAKCRTELDLHMQQKWQQANAQGLKLCYCGELSFKQDGDKTVLVEGRVGLSFRAADDPLVGICAADNIAVIRSDWHDSNPLIIRGPGAGINVTAAGIVTDLIKLTR
jgi:aspartokinase/homoserine dehydrogenase 2